MPSLISGSDSAPSPPLLAGLGAKEKSFHIPFHLTRFPWREPGRCLDPPPPTSLVTAQPDILSPPARPTHALTRLLLFPEPLFFLNLGAKGRDFRLLIDFQIFQHPMAWHLGHLRHNPDNWEPVFVTISVPPAFYQILKDFETIFSFLGVFRFFGNFQIFFWKFSDFLGIFGFSGF